MWKSKDLKTFLLAVHQTLNDVFPPDYVIFANLVQEFVYSGRKDILQRAIDTCEAMFVNRNELDMFSDMCVSMTRFALESLLASKSTGLPRVLAEKDYHVTVNNIDIRMAGN